MNDRLSAPAVATLPIEGAFDLAGQFSEHIEGYDYAFRTWDDVCAFVLAWYAAREQ